MGRGTMRTSRSRAGQRALVMAAALASGCVDHSWGLIELTSQNGSNGAVTAAFARGPQRTSSDDVVCQPGRFGGSDCAQITCKRERIGSCTVDTCTRVDGVTPLDAGVAPVDLGGPFLDFDLGPAPRDFGAPADLAAPDTLNHPPSAGLISITSLAASLQLSPSPGSSSCKDCTSVYGTASASALWAGAADRIKIRALGDDVPPFSLTVSPPSTVSLVTNSQGGSARIGSGVNWREDLSGTTAGTIVYALASSCDADLRPLQATTPQPGQTAVSAVCEIAGGGAPSPTAPTTTTHSGIIPGDVTQLFPLNTPIPVQVCSRVVETTQAGGFDVTAAALVPASPSSFTITFY